LSSPAVSKSRREPSPESPVVKFPFFKPPAESPPVVKAEIENVNFYYGEVQALKNISFPILENAITALVGPSGCGKTTLLRCFNRMHDFYPRTRYEGAIRLFPSGVNVLGQDVDPLETRLKTGMVFQKPNPFPKTIFDNVAYGLRMRGIRNKAVLHEKVEAALQSAALWEEVKDRLNHSAYQLSGGQQQRLCVARALATDPEILLLDEPTSAMDPIATSRIEDLIFSLRKRVTIVIVTHNMGQAARVSSRMAFMYMGELIEYGETAVMFQKPAKELTENYLTGRFG
jgi:phosphate transport system ATP-binding protein